MVNLLIGSVTTAGFLLLLYYVRQRSLRIGWWKWILVVLGFIYALFVMAVVAAFLEEGAGRAAIVMGGILGLVAVVWGVLLGRFVFARAAKRASQSG
jgi:hypothetical protein